MPAQIRLLVLVLALAYSAVFGPGSALGNFDPGHWLGRWKPTRLRLHRPLLPRVAAPVPVGARAVQFARRLVGVPYRYGGDSPGSGFDCSGFVRYVYAHFGLRLPHSSYADFGLGRRVERRALRPGDLVFFDGVSHVGMYVGGGRFIHAPHTGTSVQVTSLREPWYRASYDGARRLVAARPAPRQLRIHIRLPRLRLF
jgi:cell wall-associated NlpC family hydrolase